MKIVVIGAGTMGAGIAQVAVASGLEAVLVDVDEAALARGVARVEQGLEGAVARGKLAADALPAARARLSAERAIEPAVAAADVVIEAVPEVLELKRRVFQAVAAAAPPAALLASNTSALSIGEIAEATPAPERVVGMHFFNPVPAMKLLEIVRHPRASEESVARARELGVRLGKEPIIVADAPGFASSRLGVLLGLEAARMLEAGVASAADIDKAMRLGYGHPMGPLELGDLVGLDVRLAIAEHLERAIGPQFRPPEILRARVREGKLGKKTGEGFHVWRDGKIVHDI
jgi:3-hydroxybutyryl-CoA dehydrogenase